MSELDELYTDLSADPEAGDPNYRGRRARCAAALAAMTQRHKAGNGRKAHLKGDRHRADASLRKFSGEAKP